MDIVYVLPERSKQNVHTHHTIRMEVNMEIVKKKKNYNINWYIPRLVLHFVESKITTLHRLFCAKLSEIYVHRVMLNVFIY